MLQALCNHLLFKDWFLTVNALKQNSLSLKNGTKYTFIIIDRI